jgi:predicted dehydrogenase
MIMTQGEGMARTNLQEQESAAPGRQEPPADLRIGMVGVGYWGPKLARNFNEIPGASLTCVADLRPERLAEIKTLFPQVMTTDRYEAMLESVDAVVIATPVHTHFALAAAALEAGKHVLVEKPITANANQARQLIALAEKKQKTLMVGHTFVYNPAVEAIQKIIQSGELGEIYYINATRANLGLLQPDINVMWDLAPHDISLLRYILGSDPTRLYALGSVYVNTSSQLHEVVYLTMYFGDTLVNLRLSWLDPVKQRRITIVGSKKMLVYDDIAENKVVVFDKGVEVPPYSVTEDEFRASYRHGGEQVYPLEWVEPLRKECTHFLDCIRTRAVPHSSGEDGLRVVQILETAQRSLLNQGCEQMMEYQGG